MSSFKQSAFRLLEPLAFPKAEVDRFSLSEFHLQGEFLGVIDRDKGEPKYIRLGTDRGVARIKLAKELRSTVERLQPGELIQVWGERKIKLKHLEIKLKATEITSVSVPKPSEPPSAPPKCNAVAKPCDRILVCQKSDCCQRGARQVIAALETAIKDKGLQDQVKIVKTGCIKNCKAGPNLTIASDKTRYSRMSAREIPALVEKHFGT